MYKVNAMTKIFLATSAVLCLAFPAAAEEETDYDARLTQAAGEVTVFAADQAAEGVPADADMPLEAGDRVVTGADGTCEIALDAEHAITLKENSSFTLSKPAKADTILELTVGSLLAKFSKLLAGQSVKVRTPTAVAAVRGTELGVEVEGSESHVAVFDEGRVEVESEGGKETLISNQETVVRRGARPLAPYQIKRLMRHRRFMRAHLKRRPGLLRQAWRRLPPQDRARLRREIIQKRLEWRRQRLEQMRQKMQERRREDGPRRRRPDQEKMERRKREIMERRRRQQ